MLSAVLLIGLFSGLSAFALEADYDYTVLSDGTVEITYYKGTDANVVIPETIDGYTVTSIGDSAFLMRTGITSVEIPETVKYIGAKAFSNCSGITEIVLPESIRTIGDEAFA